jgi:hypothetical protein
MSENLAEFLNDNAGLVADARGRAISRNITATNRSVSALQDELVKLQEQLAKEQTREERERLNRDMLFQVSRQVEAVNSVPVSPATYIALVRVSEDFQRLGFTSGTFSSLQDKAFLSEVSLLVDQSFATMWESFSEELREQIADLVEWNCLKELGDSIAIADQRMPRFKASLSEALKEGEVLRKKKPSVFSHKIWNFFMLGPLLICFFSIFWLAAGDPNKPPLMAALLMFLSPLFALFAWLARLFAVDGDIAMHTSETTENSNRANSLRDQLSFLESHRVLFAQRLFELQRVPVDTINFLTAETVDTQERFSQVDQISAYVVDLCSKLGLDKRSLPTAPERQAMGGLLANRM